jgi:predicted dehydrogenase
MIKLGVIGLGNGGRNHVRTHSQGHLARVVAVSDVDKARLKTVAAEYAVPSAYADWRRLIDDPEVEAVILATPPFMRREMFLAAAEAGKAILAEKPFGVSLTEAREMAQAARRYKVKAMVNFGTRNLPTYKKVRQLVQSGTYGTPQWVWYKYFLVANPKRFIPPGWFWQKKYSGGHLCENAGHAFDLVCELMGPVKNVTGTTATLPLKHYAETLTQGQPDIENLGVATLQHHNGGVTVLANGSNPAGKWGMSFDLITDTSILSVSGDKVIEIMQDGKRVYRYASPVGWDPIPRGSRAFVRYLINGGNADDSIATCEDGVRAMQIAEAAYQSAAKGRTVAFNKV